MYLLIDRMRRPVCAKIRIAAAGGHHGLLVELRRVLDLLLKLNDPLRVDRYVREVYEAKRNLECVWTGKSLQKGFERGPRDSVRPLAKQFLVELVSGLKDGEQRKARYAADADNCNKEAEGNRLLLESIV